MISAGFGVFNCRRFPVGQHLYHDAAYELAPYFGGVISCGTCGHHAASTGFCS